MQINTLGSGAIAKTNRFTEEDYRVAKKNVNYEICGLVLATGIGIGAYAGSVALGLVNFSWVSVFQVSTCIGGATIGLALKSSHLNRRIIHYLPAVKSEKLVTDIFPILASYVDFDTHQALALVSKGTNGVVSFLNEKRREAVKGIAFGAKEWREYFLYFLEEPPLPQNILEILNSQCHLDSSRKVKDTHILALVPKNLTLEGLDDLAKGYFPLKACFWEATYSALISKAFPAPIEKSFWVLMSKDILSESTNLHFIEQQKMVNKLSETSGIKCEIPTALEVAICVFTHYARSKEYLFIRNIPQTVTRCIDSHNKVIIGYLPILNSLLINVYTNEPDSDIGVVVMRRFKPL